MFYYYGRKKKIAALYPEPQQTIVIEPFAGSAAYALHGSRWQNQVILVERDPQIAALWRWLINEATSESILALPDPIAGEKTQLLLHILHMASKRWYSYRSATPTPFTGFEKIEQAVLTKAGFGPDGMPNEENIRCL